MKGTVGAVVCSSTTERRQTKPRDQQEVLRVDAFQHDHDVTERVQMYTGIHQE